MIRFRRRRQAPVTASIAHTLCVASRESLTKAITANWVREEKLPEEQQASFDVDRHVTDSLDQLIAAVDRLAAAAPPPRPARPPRARPRARTMIARHALQRELELLTKTEIIERCLTARDRLDSVEVHDPEAQHADVISDALDAANDAFEDAMRGLR